MAESGISHQKRKKAETGSVDRLSSLPDSLILHILSFLPTKEAVATSFLSKRSKPLWRSLHSLDFDDDHRDFSGESSFFQFVDAVLVLRDLEPIKRFRLHCHFPVSQSHFNVWINAAINRDVEELVISPWNHMILPSSIFVCSTIRVLKLKQVKVCTISSVHLPSLKVLHLAFTRFEDKECAVKLLSGCKLLEELVIKNSFDIHSIGNVEGSTQLVRAQVDPPIIFQPWKALHDVQFLTLDMVTELSDSWWYVKCIPVYPNLTHLEFIRLDCSWGFLMRWLQKCPKLQTLVIHKLGSTFTQPSDGGTGNRLMEPEIVLWQPAWFHLEEFYLGECQGLDKELQLARLIMENARVLETMTICSISSSGENEKLQMIKRLASYPRRSETCRLLFS